MLCLQPRPDLRWDPCRAEPRLLPAPDDGG